LLDVYVVIGSSNSALKAKQLADCPVDDMSARERERLFVVGAPLAIFPALAFLPTVIFLIVFPQISHGRMIGLLVLPPCLFAGSTGLWKLALGAVEKPWGIFNVLSFSVLLILLVIAGYTGLFLALITLRI
jgi:hypothetical protein